MKKIKTETQKARERLQRQIKKIEKKGFSVDETLKQISKKGTIRQIEKIDQDMILRRSTIEIDGTKKTGKEIIKEMKEKGVAVLKTNELLKKAEIEKIKKIKDIKRSKIEEAIENRLAELEARAEDLGQKKEAEKLRKITAEDIQKTARDIEKNIAAQIIENNDINEMSKKMMEGEASFGGSGAYEKLKKGARKYDVKGLQEKNRLYKKNLLKGVEHQINTTSGSEREKWKKLKEKMERMNASEVFRKMEKSGEVSRESRKTVFSYSDPLIASIDSENSLDEIMSALS